MKHTSWVLAMIALAGSASADTGQHVYETVCSACHATGVMAAPKFGSQGDWQPRIAKGEKTLLAHALNGFNAMPAKGGCTRCSDKDIKAALAHMIGAATGP